MPSIVFCFSLALLVLATIPHAHGQPLDATFRHPLGVHFSHPSTWQHNPVSESALALVPADVLLHEGQPSEVIVVMGEDAGGLTDPAHPEVIAYVDQVVTGTFGYLARAGDVQTRTVGAHAVAVVTWEGRSPSAQQVRARMWITILQEHALAVLAVAPPERLTEREPTLEAIVASFGYQAPKGDARLVGRWRYTDTYVSGDFSMVDEEHLVLEADGTFRIGGRVMGGMQHSDDAGMYTGDSSVDSGRRADAHGRWHTHEKRITLRWENGRVEEWEYLISAGEMMFRSGDAKKLWERLR